MQLSASLDVVAIVLVLLIVVTGYIVSSYRQYNLLKRIDHKLALLLRDLGNDKRDSNDTSDT